MVMVPEEQNTEREKGQELCESRGKGALCIRQQPSHRCYPASPTFSLYLHRTSVLSLESQLDVFFMLQSVTYVSYSSILAAF